MCQYKTCIILILLVIVCGSAMGCNNNTDMKNTKADFNLSGISDYTVVTNTGTSLQNSVSETPLDELGSMAVTLQGRSSRKAYVEDLSSISYLELRDVGNVEGSQTYYCIFVDGSDKLYLFLYEEDHRLIILGTCCKNRDLSYKDFDSLTPGISTIQDVKKIDPVIESLPYCSCINGFPSISCEDGRTTLHMTKEGFVEITYEEKQGKTVVESVKKRSSQMIESINPLDL